MTTAFEISCVFRPCPSGWAIKAGKTIENAGSPLRFTFNQSSHTHTHTGVGLSFFPFYVISSSGSLLIGAGRMDGWWEGEENHSHTHTREIWHNYPNCVRRRERDPIARPSSFLPLPLPAWKIIVKIKDHQGKSKKKKNCERPSQWPMSCSQRFLEESWRQGATQGPSLPEG